MAREAQRLRRNFCRERRRPDHKAGAPTFELRTVVIRRWLARFHRGHNLGSRGERDAEPPRRAPIMASDAADLAVREEYPSCDDDLRRAVVDVRVAAEAGLVPYVDRVVPPVSGVPIAVASHARPRCRILDPAALEEFATICQRMHPILRSCRTPKKQRRHCAHNRHPHRQDHGQCHEREARRRRRCATPSRLGRFSRRRIEVVV